MSAWSISSGCLWILSLTLPQPLGVLRSEVIIFVCTCLWYFLKSLVVGFPRNIFNHNKPNQTVIKNLCTFMCHILCQPAALANSSGKLYKEKKQKTGAPSICSCICIHLENIICLIWIMYSYLVTSPLSALIFQQLEGLFAVYTDAMHVSQGLLD